MKPRVYVETSIVSYLTARPCNDLRVAANQSTTIEWWERHRLRYDLYVSEFVIAEAGLGDGEAAAKRLSIVTSVPALEVTEEVRVLGKLLVSEGPIPVKAEIDAYHIAVAAINGMDYLLTWNCTHIANAAIRSRIEETCRRHGIEPPIICTPLELFED
ncbi:MAG: type II toxin-antitoxin system VapC family toxin [Candidatus Hydrogenedentes bacterium]|nr:type II toxin-antitoxin system VapC family toxin [Candidatus Hydrogenedentota bacterium]